MVMFPQSNARLLAIGRGRLSEDYDRAAGAETVIWSGNTDSYVQTNILSMLNGQGTLDRILNTTIIIPGDLPVDIQAGDVLTYASGDPDTATVMSGTVQSFITPAELPSLPDYFKVTLEQVQAVEGA